jgi:hypothetical protein
MLAFFVIALGCCLCGEAQAQTVLVQHSFTGGASPLNGTLVSGGSLQTGSLAWVANPAYTANGTFSLTSGASAVNGCAYLDLGSGAIAMGQPTNIYELDVVVDNTTDNGVSKYSQVTAGFWAANPGTASYHGTGGCAWFYWWGDGEFSASTGAGFIGDILPKTSGIPFASGFESFKFILTLTNATLSNNTVAFYYHGGVQLGVITNFSGDEGFRYLGIGARAGGANQTASGIIQSITLKRLDTPMFSYTNITLSSGVIWGILFTGVSIAGMATDPQGYSLTYSKVSGPAWLTIGADGSLLGTPSAGDLGTNSWVVKADDGHGRSAQATLNITVYTPSVVCSTAWPYSSGGVPARVAAAQYSGLYAVAGNNIEITRINQSPTDIITNATMQSLLAGALLNGMAFTASGRQLFLSVHGTSGDAVLAYNMGTKQLRTFVSGLSLGLSSNNPTQKLGIAHYMGQLYVGTALGEIRSYTAPLNGLTGTNTGSVRFTGADTNQPVCAMSVDIQGNIIYVASSNYLYRLNPTNLTLTQIASLSGIKAISFGRTYGAVGQGGLLVLQDAGIQRMLYLAPTTNLQAGGSPVVLNAYYSTTNVITDIAATACGRLLTAQAVPQILADTRDTRMNFTNWVADEFNQYTLMAKNLCWQDGQLPGMCPQLEPSYGSARSSSSVSESSAGTVFQLLMADKVNGDPEARGLVRQILTRYATLECNADGQLYAYFDCNTGANTDNHSAQCYSTKETISMAVRAKAYYANDSDIVNAANIIIGRLKNQKDYVQEGGGFSSGNATNASINPAFLSLPYQECHDYGELTAATEPRCENAYLDYWHYRSDMKTNTLLPGEPIIGTNVTTFMRMVDTSLIQFCRDDPDWTQEFRNYYALFAGWTDDNAPDHLTVFGVGSVPTGGPPVNGIYPSQYSPDTYTTHPGTVNSFACLIGFGLLGDTVPVVGAYYAYRDGRRQLMQGSAKYPAPNLLTKISYDMPGWVMPSWAPVDYSWGGIALGGLISPGSIESAVSMYMWQTPTVTTAANGDKTIVFSKIVRRQVLATANGTNWDSLGFQYSPVTVAAFTGYNNLMVQGAEGELLKLVNADFNSGLTGWNQTGDIAASISSSFGLFSNCVVLTATSGTQFTTNVLEQSVDVSGDLDGTLYLVRAIGKSPDAVNGLAYLRVRWFNSTNFVSEQDSSALTSSLRRANYLISAIKPTNATTMVIGLVAVKGNPLGAAQERYGFDEVSVVREGAEQYFDNAGFGLGNLTGWTVTTTDGKMTATVTNDTRLGSSYALALAATTTATNKSEVSVYHEYDITADPIGTHYLLEYDLLTENLEKSSVRTTVTVLGGAYVSTNNTWVDRVANFDKYSHPYSVTKLSAGLKKTYTTNLTQTLRFQIRLRRDSAPNTVANERVLIDNVRLLRTPPNNVAAPAVTTQGTPYSWLDNYGLVANAYYKAAALSDPNGNGLAAWQDYIAGLNPTDPTSTFKVVSIQPQSATNYLVKWTSVAGKTYTLESKTNLGASSWIPVQSAIPATPPTNSMSVNVGGNSSVFFRVKVGN